MCYKFIKYSAVALATGAVAYIHRDKITECCSKTKEIAKDLCDIKSVKPTIVLLYSSSPCDCNTDDCKGERNKVECFCGCDLETYKKCFEKYACKANTRFIDAECPDGEDEQDFNDYIDRFEIDYVPTVLLISPCNNLIAKVESPEKQEDIEKMLNYCLNS